MRATGTVLDRIVADTRRRLATHPPDRAALERAIAGAAPPPDALGALTTGGVRIIAEVKRKSPSAQAIRLDADPVTFARAYAAGGAAAISVLTEPAHFGGSLDDLAAVAAAVPLPCLRKDFIVSPLQLLEARAAGAALVLLIAAVLDRGELTALAAEAGSLGLTALVEAHDADEVKRALDAGAAVVGVNNRDLRTFAIDLGTCEELRGLIPPGVVAVAESGIETAGDIARLARAGFAVFLIGSSLMRAPDPAATVKQLIEGAEARV